MFVIPASLKPGSRYNKRLFWAPRFKHTGMTIICILIITIIIMKRKFPRTIKRVVIKVGSSLLVTGKLRPRQSFLESLTSQICALRRQGIDVVLVSSGAIAMGLGELKKKTRDLGLPFLQASAAIGQAKLMEIYSELFRSRKSKCAQILLTHEDFDNRKRHTNARQTFKALFESKVVPIVNENDTISTEEIKFGDNDRLSVMVSNLIQADLLIILSDVDGFYDTDKEVIEEVSITAEIYKMAGGTSKKLLAKGGMKAKLDAIHMAGHSKIPCVIANGRSKDPIKRIIAGERIGTYFVEKNDKIVDRKWWISFVTKPKGVVKVDDGAKKAILSGGKSLLLPGVVVISGEFKKGDVLLVTDKKGEEIARGLSKYNSDHVMEMIDVGQTKGVDELIHVDDLVLSVR